MSRRSLVATGADAGRRLDQFLARELSWLSVGQAGALADSGRVHVRGKVARSGRKLWGNEIIEIDLPDPTPVHASVDAPTIPVLHQDANLIVVDKPTGLVVESEGNGRSVVEIVGARCAGCEVGGVAAPGVAHRLDRETTGCLALARTDAALVALKQAFEDKLVHKTYLALVLGQPPDSLRLEGPYSRDPRNPRLFTTKVESARRAALSFTVRERLAGAALLEVTLETGRTHQIRVQLYEAGFPVLGDSLYGSDDARQHPAALVIGRQALHALRLQLPGVSVEAAVPEDLQRALRALGGG